MHKIILAAAIAALASTAGQAADDANKKSADEAASTPAPAAWSINETSWEFTVNGMPMQESIDASGNYIINSGDEHIDHGTAVVKDGKICNTSAMNNDGETCWSLGALEVGASGEAVSDAGQKLTVTRIAYAPLTM